MNDSKCGLGFMLRLYNKNGIQSNLLKLFFFFLVTLHHGVTKSTKCNTANQERALYDDSFIKYFSVQCF